MDELENKVILDGDLHPDSLDMKVLCNFLLNYSEMMRKISNNDSLELYLTGVEDKCVMPLITSNYPDQLNASQEKLIKHILDPDKAHIPYTCTSHIEKINALLDKHKMTLTLKANRVNIEGKKLIPQVQNEVRKEYLELYAEVTMVGGVKPSVHLKYNGYNITTKVSKDIALKLSQKLYHLVLIKGLATITNDKVTSIKINEVDTSYGELKPSEALDQLHPLLSDFYQDKDPIAYIHELRG